MEESLKQKAGSCKDEPASSGESGDESGSEPESPNDKLMHMQSMKQEWAENREGNSSRDHNSEPHASTSSTVQEADSSKSHPSLPKLMPKIDLPGGAMLYHSGVLAGLEGMNPNLGLGNLAMGYPHSFILGLANQAQEAGASSSSTSQPQFITIPLSMMAAQQNGASSDDSSELQDLSTASRK